MNDDVIFLKHKAIKRNSSTNNARRENIKPDMRWFKEKSKEMTQLSKLKNLHKKFRSQRAKYLRACRNKKDLIKNIDLEIDPKAELDFSEPPSDINDRNYVEKGAFSQEERLEWLYNYLISPAAFRNCNFRLLRKPSDSTVRCWKKRLINSKLFPKSIELQSINNIGLIIKKWKTYYQNLFKDDINGVLMTDAMASTSYVSYNKGKWEGLLPSIEPEFEEVILTDPNKFESFVNQLKNQKLVVTDIFVFYYAPLTNLRSVPLFVYQSNKGNADEKTDYFLLKIEDELEKNNLHVIAKAFDADPGYLKYVRKMMLDIRNTFVEHKFEFLLHLPKSKLIISDPAHLLKRFRRISAMISRRIINCEETVTCYGLDSILKLNYARMWDTSPQSKLNDFYPAVLFTHENATKVIKSKRWPYVFAFLPPCCLNITLRCHNINRFQRTRLLILGFFIMFIHYETLISDKFSTKSQEGNVFSGAIIIQYIVTLAAMISIFLNIFNDFGLDRIGTLILEHFFGKLRQLCKDQHVETLLRRIQDLIILELIRDEKQDIKIPKRNFDTSRSGFGKVNFDVIEIEKIFSTANMICQNVNQHNLGFIHDSQYEEDDLYDYLIKLFTLDEGTYLYHLRPSTANQKINTQSNSIINRFRSQKTSTSKRNEDQITIKKKQNIDYNSMINEQFPNELENLTINVIDYLAKIKGVNPNQIESVEEEEDVYEEWNAKNNEEESESEQSDSSDIEEIEELFSLMANENENNIYCEPSSMPQNELNEEEKFYYDYYKQLGVERKNNLPLCYLITCLQILFNNQEFNDLLKNINIPSNAPILREYLTIRDSLPRNILPFYSLIKKNNVKFVNDNQEDIVEIFQFIFALITDELSDINIDHTFTLKNIFCSEIIYSIECENCRGIGSFSDFSNCIMMKITHDTLEENLEDFFVNEERDQITCDHCKGKTNCKNVTKKFKYKSMPQYLIFQFARFKFTKKLSKIHKTVKFPLSINEENLHLESQILYMLHQVIYHEGSAQQGHNYTDIFDYDNEIIVRYNDEKVEILKEIDMNNKNAYVMIYKRVNLDK